MTNQIFYTINPHLNNYSIQTLIETFTEILKRYYRQTLGPRYYKQKDKQHFITIFPEKTNKGITEPHLHMIIEIKPEEQQTFFDFMNSRLKAIYKSLTTHKEEIKTLEGVINYCLKESPKIYNNNDLYELDSTNKLINS